MNIVMTMNNGVIVLNVILSVNDGSLSHLIWM